MSKVETTTSPSTSPSQIQGRNQSQLDWNARRKPAVTPRREFAFTRQFPMLWMQSPVSGCSSGSGGAAIQ